MKRLTRLSLLVFGLLFLLVCPLANLRTASAHGGVIIDGGITDHYEWVAMASPFPVTPGETILTVLIYDIETYAPINGLVPTMELAPPNAARPCCSGDDTIGPLSLLVDPLLYPGDYSNIILMLQEGNWQGKFTIDESDPLGPGERVEIFFEVDVMEATEGEERPTPIQGDIISLTATAVANGADPSSGTTGEQTSEDGYPIPQLVPQNSAAVGTATPYPAPQVNEATELTGQTISLQSNAELETSEPEAEAPQPVAGVDVQPDVQTPSGAADAEGSSAAGPSWASENIWLLAALALVPLLLIVLWLALSNNNSANEWSGDDEDDEGDEGENEA